MGGDEAADEQALERHGTRHVGEHTHQGDKRAMSGR
jgi:hypothetical protein